MIEYILAGIYTLVKIIPIFTTKDPDIQEKLANEIYSDMDKMQEKIDRKLQEQEYEEQSNCKLQEKEDNVQSDHHITSMNEGGICNDI